LASIARNIPYIQRRRRNPDSLNKEKHGSTRDYEVLSGSASAKIPDMTFFCNQPLITSQILNWTPAIDLQVVGAPMPTTRLRRG
jgi:hypothetical protein